MTIILSFRRSTTLILAASFIAVAASARVQAQAPLQIAQERVEPTNEVRAAPAAADKEPLVQYWVGVLGLLATAASALYAGVQVNLAKRQMKMVVYATVTDRVFSVNQLFINHPEFRRYFYGKEHPVRTPNSQNDYERIVSVAEYILDFSSSILEHKELLEEKKVRNPKPGSGSTSGQISWGEWEKYIEDIMENSPVLCRLLLEKREWYEDNLWKLSPLNRQNIQDKLSCEMNEERVEQIICCLFPRPAIPMVSEQKETPERSQ